MKYLIVILNEFEDFSIPRKTTRDKPEFKQVDLLCPMEGIQA